MPSRWLGFWTLFTSTELTLPRWVWIITSLLGAFVLLTIPVVWFKFGWQAGEITTELLIMASFVILIGVVLLKSKPEVKHDVHSAGPSDGGSVVFRGETLTGPRRPNTDVSVSAPSDNAGTGSSGGDS